MLDSLSPQQSFYHEDQGQGFDLAYLVGVLKRRALYFAFPFVIVAILGLTITEQQQPIYRAEGKLLVESSGISNDLLHQTISELIDERFEVYKERILAPDHLVATVEKFNLFPRDRDRMSVYQLLELMRKRVAIKPVPLEMQPNRPTTAFSVSFDYEVPELALKVDNEFVHEILAQDSSRRTSSATQTAQILEDQVTKLKTEYDAVVAQLEAIKQRPPDQQQAASEELKTQMNALAALQSELVQKSAVYSDEHPVIKKLKNQIAVLKRTIATAPQKTPASAAADRSDANTQILEQREVLLQKNLDVARNKLAVAQIGETLEKNSQADHLQVIQYPELPGQPAKPKKLKWLAMSVALAGMIGVGSVLAAELLDRSIRSKKELARIIDPHLIVTIPYLLRPGEQLRRRVKFILLYIVLLAVAGVGATTALLTKKTPADFVGSNLVSR